MELDSPENFLLENWVRFHSQESEPQNDDDEAFSLCELATNDRDNPAENHPEKPFSAEQEEEFDFSGGGSNLPENQMCSADELFFRGQILPLRHSVTLPSGFTTRTREFTRSISFSASEPVSVSSSRSSSTRSHNSGSSGSSSTSRSEFTGYKHTVGTRNRNRNQFHSQPSPTPQIRNRSFGHSNPKSSSKWSFLQLGPLKQQEIGLADLKNRSQRSQGSSNKDQNQAQNEKKKKQILLFGGCKCSAKVIESTVASRIPMVKPTALKEEETRLRISKESTVGVSSHRTSEWLNQFLNTKS